MLRAETLGEKVLGNYAALVRELAEDAPPLPVGAAAVATRAAFTTRQQVAKVADVLARPYDVRRAPLVDEFEPRQRQRPSDLRKVGVNAPRAAGAAPPPSTAARPARPARPAALTAAVATPAARAMRGILAAHLPRLAARRAVRPQPASVAAAADASWRAIPVFAAAAVRPSTLAWSAMAPRAAARQAPRLVRRPHRRKAREGCRPHCAVSGESSMNGR